jgi:hypothetical protein
MLQRANPPRAEHGASGFEAVGLDRNDHVPFSKCIQSTNKP